MSIKVITKFIYYMHYTWAYKSSFRKHAFNKLIFYLFRTENIILKGENNYAK